MNHIISVPRLQEIHFSSIVLAWSVGRLCCGSSDDWVGGALSRLPNFLLVVFALWCSILLCAIIVRLTNNHWSSKCTFSDQCQPKLFKLLLVKHQNNMKQENTSQVQAAKSLSCSFYLPVWHFLVQKAHRATFIDRLAVTWSRNPSSWKEC